MLRASIPFVDLRGKTPVDLLRSYPDKAHDLIRSSREIYGTLSYIGSKLALPFADRRSHGWLKRTKNPYLHEIENYADILNLKGVYAFNIAYEWGCTSGAYRAGAHVALLRVLDWPFPALGKHVMVVLQSGKAGDFYNITWPGLSGVFTGMKPHAYAAAINQAPMRKHNKGFAVDWVKNRQIAHGRTALPPAHLLRYVFEHCATYAEAKELLATTPVALPVIYTLAGTRQGEGCVIERLEDAAQLREIGPGQQVTAANHFLSSFSETGHGWWPRAIDSAGRWRQSCTLHGHDLEQPDFDWLQAPMLNIFTRLCVVTDAATGRLTVQGYEGTTPVTELFSLPMAEVKTEDVLDEIVDW